MMLQDKKIDKDDILKYCEITIDVVTGVFHWLMKRYDANPENVNILHCTYCYCTQLAVARKHLRRKNPQKSPKKIRGDSCNEYQVGDGNAQI